MEKINVTFEVNSKEELVKILKTGSSHSLLDFKVIDFYVGQKTEHSINYNKALELLKQLSCDERMEIFSEFCTYCGGDDPRCQCWNDE